MSDDRSLSAEEFVDVLWAAIDCDQRLNARHEALVDSHEALRAQVKRLEERVYEVKVCAAVVQEYVIHRKGCPSYPHGFMACDCGLREAVHRLGKA